MKIDIKDYCQSSNATKGVIDAINNANDGDIIFFPKDEYHFFKEQSIHKVYHMTNTDSFVKPDKYFAVLVENKNDITIDGNGSTFVIHGNMCSFAAVKCNNITLKNITIKYNAPTNIEFKVEKIESNKITYSLPKTTQYTIRGRNITFFEESPFTKEHYYDIKNNTKTYCNVMHKGNEVYRTQLSPLKGRLSIKKADNNKLTVSYIIPPKFEIGDIITMSQNYLRDNCGLFFWECSNMIFDNITVNYMHGFGWLSQMCENITFNKVQFKPDDEHIVSSFADSIHICGCKGKVKINECLFTHPHDDGINIHGAFLRTKKIIDAKTAEFEFVHKQQGGYKAFFAGDKVKFYKRSNLEEFNGTYTVESTEDHIDNKTVVIKFKEKLPALTEKMTVIENVTYNPEVEISNCIFRAIPTRGILCTTDRKSEIHDNLFESLKMPDIFISCDCRDWYESGPCKNMKIYNNIFSQKEPVLLKPICVGTAVDNVHENIEIYNNQIKENTF